MKYLQPLITLTFAYPLLLWLPFIIVCLWWAGGHRTVAIPYGSSKPLDAVGVSPRAFFRKLILGFLATLFIVCLSIAAARPQRNSLLENPAASRNLMLAIDVSPSMGANDFAAGAGIVSRLKAVQTVVAQFIQARSQDRIGLVVFGGRSFLQAPLTKDHELILQLVKRLQVGMAGDGTAVGDGLGLALKRVQELRESLEEPKAPAAVILLTDGVSNAGQVNPIKAAKVAKDLEITVHTIGIGSNEPVTMTMPGGILGQRFQTRVEFDEESLKEIAKLTDGVYFNANSVEGLERVYGEIDKLETTVNKDDQVLIHEELFYPYALIALGAYVLYLLCTYHLFPKIP